MEGISSDGKVLCRRKRFRKNVTSGCGGFAGVRIPHHASSSGQHSLTGVELTVARLSSDERPPHRS